MGAQRVRRGHRAGSDRRLVERHPDPRAQPVVTAALPGQPAAADWLLMRVSPRLAGHLAIAVHDYRKRCAATGAPAPLTEIEQLFQALRRVNRGQAGSPIDQAAETADAAPVTPRL